VKVEKGEKICAETTRNGILKSSAVLLLKKEVTHGLK
jgi:hypothetical protein